MTPGQSRSARILLDWTHVELAQRAGISPAALSRYERGEGISCRTFEKLSRALEEAGIRFEGDWAVCLMANGRPRKHTKRRN